MSTRLEHLFLTVGGDNRQDRQYTAAQVAAVLDGAGSGGTARTQMTASYSTPSDPASVTVYYTAINPSGGVITARTTSNVLFFNGLYQYTQDTSLVTDFIAIWDEGDPDAFTSEWIVVDT